ncbi:MAG: ComEC/Rec2 family competence protein, partial [Paracoccaceae bacterium]|nr:ComEC/Rec2 family competence protein [Paracoccaceae bacterium]
AAPILEARTGAVTLRARALDVETFPDSVRVTFDRVQISNLGPEGTPERVRLRIKGDQPRIHPGDWVRARAILSPPAPPAAPGAFDFQRRAYFDRLGAVGFALGKVEIYIAGDKATGGSPLNAFWIGVADLRHEIITRITAAFPPEQNVRSGIAAALMTGERSAIPEDVLAAMRDSGLAHLLAISGLHVGLIAGILFFGVRAGLALVPRIALRYPIKKWAAGIACIGALAYALLAGATVPTQRAFLMIGLVLLAVVLDRRGLSMRMVAFAATVILLMRPESLLGASFQLSFAAVVALIAAYERFVEAGFRRKGARTWVRRVGRYLGGVALTTLIAGAATAPFAAYHFNRVAYFGLVANLLAVPVTALWVMPWAIVSFVLMPFGWEGAALQVMGLGIALVAETAQTVGGWPGAVTRLPAGGGWALFLVSAGGLWLCLWQRRWRYGGVGAIAAGILVFALAQPPDVLIGADGKLMAVRTDGGNLAVSTVRTKAFERALWLRRQGLEEEEDAVSWAAYFGASEPGFRCDGLGCIYQRHARRVALVHDGRALVEDCRTADVVIATVPVRATCPGPEVVIDWFDLWAKGAHALWIGDDGRLSVKTVAGERGHRPWTGPVRERRARGGT